jgi:hypothetical protein
VAATGYSQASGEGYRSFSTSSTEAEQESRTFFSASSPPQPDPCFRRLLSLFQGGTTRKPFKKDTFAKSGFARANSGQIRANSGQIRANSGQIRARSGPDPGQTPWTVTRFSDLFPVEASLHSSRVPHSPRRRGRAGAIVPSSVPPSRGMT